MDLKLEFHRKLLRLADLCRPEALSFNRAFKEKWEYRRFSWEPYRESLNRVREAKDPLAELRTLGLRYFNYPLWIDVAPLAEEALRILKNHPSLHWSTTLTVEPSRGWLRATIWGNSRENIADQNKGAKHAMEYLELPGVEIPHLKEFIDACCVKSQPIFLSFLKPGGHISLHRDRPGVPNGDKTRIPLVYPEDCKFLIEGVGKAPIRAGDVFMFDDRHPHAVFNDSAQTKADLAASFDMAKCRPQINEAIRTRIARLLDH